ncbi:UDP-4-amino-4,6-dideoxy-N-acetyl-beta-L-altrosamine transaminase [Ectothiorhodospira variabilis]|uniref:UDP-4-amino-4, 6-dideoxy-N-acetyl-beta-L-altrosamine transaminase n=1 Tax=Ectothiorhodospira variabilis TaxID=505694 RepID=UPI001EFC279C|nr:UDP-4-amino-4,6-dideoxy-N-acetyl-beta-L-altrosamine transaminase [Ectothiorhodospira variabilis]MCG5495987.1 UDP-4-amino-4,6-dideoxy-N-acetyl-beta-L-altrosamine transaminase [Ectothiorhodospira variabilis]MCG5505342.1 UDP-4-amino-4,6-dideoxy-N-acetyl-beta-L-altrosamine transaminase [Ectothiorhodospira variabilis]MCG5508528.1 UDP-4-amino-4,6-dideoxy-N-acetyl-beta-L-altrosamine transaminase [Ectothiorhodospira variabilis]
MIPYGRQDITEDDIQAVEQVLRSDWLTQGPMVPRFEQAVADYCGAAHGVAVNSATSALHIACLALDVGPDDWVWTSPNTFVASANCARYCGAHVDFVDIDPHTWNMSVARLREKLEQARAAQRLPKVVIPVHFAGQPCDMPAIHQLAQEFGFRIIEDASHAVGASQEGVKVGACAYSDISVFSFHPVKIITTAEGGMALTNHPQLAERMERLRSHGITRDPEQMQGEPIGPWYYEQLELGSNYRMTDLQAALGLSQLNRLDAFVSRRNALAEHYEELLSDLPIRRPRVTAGNRSAWHLYPIRLNLEAISCSHRQIFESLREAGIGVNLHYMPVHLQPYYRNLGFQPGQYPEAEAHGREAISLPMYPGLSDEQQTEVITHLTKVISG